MDMLYLQVFSEPENGWVLVPLETLITVFMVKYCFGTKIKMIMVVKQDSTPVFQIKVLGMNYEVLQKESLPHTAKLCVLPVILVERSTCVAGLCAVLRQLIKTIVAEEPSHWSRTLLGFREGCLVACAESSVWTRFCEVDMIATTKHLIVGSMSKTEVIIPEDIARFEVHMAQPIRMHNVQKKAQELMKKCGKTTYDVGDLGIVEHCFAEGPTMTLADVILFPCLHIVIESIRSVYLQQNIPLIMKWYHNMCEQDGIEESLSIFNTIPSKLVDDMYVIYNVPDVPKQSIYKSDPRRYKPRNRIFTRQEDVDASLLVVDMLGLSVDVLEPPFGNEVEFDWRSLPYDAQPEGGHLPASRRERKSQQLENLTKAVLKVAQPGHTIVDFCSGSGHLGIVLAHLLPRCHVVFLENKEESLTRARERVKKLGLSNVSFCQCNLDYFVGHFDIGTSLHACGVATDLVIQCCIKERAVFVCCPCCYGSVQNNHIITYPRSKFFRDSPMTLREYLVLGHSADQTHDENNVKTDQGKKCMGIIDKDRCLHASEAGYFVSLAKLIPESCTPKNNLLVGIPNEWQDASFYD
ncbi:hypothetical protein R5R35_008501 [Gryllus longicercus]|uniref:Methyltransferase domain-containing protein n=1 Tax=Gryllus longicercus TaxID=2509291 RepID=A0AAN9VMY0_9ORTH